MFTEQEKMKVCTKCGISYPATAEYFKRNSTSKDGLRPDCKQCGNQRYTHVCERCGKEFKSAVKCQRFCSRRCSDMLAKTFVQTEVQQTIEERKERFVKRFNEKFPKFKYVDGFTSYRCMITVECRTCGRKQVRHANSKECMTCDYCTGYELLKRRQEREMKEEEKKRELLLRGLVDAIKTRQEKLTREMMLHKKCKRCGKKYIASSLQSVHCDECIKEICELMADKKAQWKERIIQCAECGVSFEMQYLKNYYCSDACKRKAKNRINETSRRHKLKENGQVDLSISLTKLVRRDKNRCYICGGKCNSKDYYYSGDGYFVAGNNYPSIDHVVPVSTGGTHTWNNVKLAHRKCNSIKREKLVIESRGGQLMFV